MEAAGPPGDMGDFPEKGRVRTVKKKLLYFVIVFVSQCYQILGDVYDKKNTVVLYSICGRDGRFI